MNNKFFKIIFCVFLLLISLVSNIFTSDDTKNLKLEKDTYFKIQEKNVLFKKGYVQVYTKSEAIASGSLAEDIVLKIQDKKVKLKNYISLYEDRNVKSCRLKEDTVFKVQGKDIIFLTGGYERTEFYENGNIKVGLIKGKTTLKTVGGKSVNVSANNTIKLNEKGLLIVYYPGTGGG